MPQIPYVEAADFSIEKEQGSLPMPAMHHHRSNEIYYSLKGEREYFIEDRFFHLDEGDMVLIRHGLLHRTAGKGIARYLISFSDRFLQRFFTREALDPLLNGAPFIFRADEADRGRINMIFSLLLAEQTRAARDGVPCNEELVAGYLYELLFTMRHATNTYIPHDYPDERIAQVVQYINENYSQINDISEIAARFFISKYHLCRIFNKNLGIPLITYLNTIKIRHACELIKESELNLTEIAIQCGFNSSSYFCKVFKNEKSISPTEYRKQHRLAVKKLLDTDGHSVL